MVVILVAVELGEAGSAAVAKEAEVMALEVRAKGVAEGKAREKPGVVEIPQQ